ncbi:nucleotide-binding protein [Nodularia sp. NIES-3585]|uniref:nucleotide-binding protein n=1 Tax=Nodularia sp. NIES-3585 TaxID=1973477 RepID=UPI000B5C313B|nr:hypothetical protein [Nodularia sp. NIES-3585]GAX38825.1 hypothetical protein NIES3585_48770 [Nodularia sp. NIES-3585]
MARKKMTAQENSSRRLVIVTGDKGGVGKSTFARGLLQAWIDEQQDFVAFDADVSNPQIKRFYSTECTIEPVNIFKRGQTDIFLQELGKYIFPPDSIEDGKELVSPKSLFLLELPPQSSNILKDFVNDMDLFETIKNIYQMRVTMVVVISRTLDSVNQFVNLYSYCQNNVDYIVVKNNFFGEEHEFNRYNNSQVIQDIKANPENQKYIHEIGMPDLIEHAYDYLDRESYSFAKGIQQNDLIAVKGRVTAWLRNFKESIKPVRHLLGLPNSDAAK